MLAAAAIGFTSCNDSFMERYPDTSLTEQTVFSNYNTFKTYAWGLYGVFTNTNILRIPGTNGAYASATSYTSDIYAGYLMRRQGDGNPYAFQNVSSSSSGNGWAFSFVYRVNVMLANIDNSGMTDADKEHWRSVGYFFRAYYYSELIARFGDVPWVDRVLGDSDKEIAYGPRTPRKEVADHVLNDLIYAEEHIKEEGDGENTINVHVVRALLSRFCLFEGTWRKYHALGDEDKYFDACITYSKKLMDSYPELNSDWGEMLTSDLKGMKGIILYKEYVEKELTNYVLTHVERTSTHNVEMPQHIIDMYLCKDGKTIHNSSEYEWSQDGDNSMNATFRNRDPTEIEALAAKSNYPEYGISGRCNYITERGVRSLGLSGNKAQHADLTVELGFSSDMGVTNSRYPEEICEGQIQVNQGSMMGLSYDQLDITTEEMEDVDLYMQCLSVPARRNVNDPQVVKGEQNFYQAKCHLCHTTTLHTKPRGTVLLNNTQLPWLGRQTIHPYSDFLLHDMGSEIMGVGLNDNYVSGLARGNEWRTTPLWGIGLQEKVNGHTYFLHDGRARNLTEAIMWHGGEGEASKNLFKKMSKEDRDALIAFINSL